MNKSYKGSHCEKLNQVLSAIQVLCLILKNVCTSYSVMPTKKTDCVNYHTSMFSQPGRVSDILSLAT